MKQEMDTAATRQDNDTKEEELTQYYFDNQEQATQSSSNQEKEVTQSASEKEEEVAQPSSNKDEEAAQSASNQEQATQSSSNKEEEVTQSGSDKDKELAQLISSISPKLSEWRDQEIERLSKLGKSLEAAFIDFWETAKQSGKKNFRTEAKKKFEEFISSSKTPITKNTANNARDFSKNYNNFTSQQQEEIKKKTGKYSQTNLVRLVKYPWPVIELILERFSHKFPDSEELKELVNSKKLKRSEVLTEENWQKTWEIVRIWLPSLEADLIPQLQDKAIDKAIDRAKKNGSIPFRQIYLFILFLWTLESGSYSLMRYVSSQMGCSKENPTDFIDESGNIIVYTDDLVAALRGKRYSTKDLFPRVSSKKTKKKAKTETRSKEELELISGLQTEKKELTSRLETQTQLNTQLTSQLEAQTQLNEQLTSQLEAQAQLNEQLTSELTNLKEQQNKYQEEITSLKTQHDEYQKQITSLKTKHDESQEEITSLKAWQDNIQHQIDELRSGKKKTKNGQAHSFKQMKQHQESPAAKNKNTYRPNQNNGNASSHQKRRLTAAR